jgi:hypothetical protein
MLWAWERPENLEFIDPRETGGAYLAGRSPPPRLSPEQREQSVSAIVRMCNRPGLTATQIDLDARASERAFDVLHQRYPKSPWAQQTPYWYR